MDKIIQEKDIEKTKRIINLSKRPIIVLAQDEVYNRKILEYGKFDVLLSPEEQTEKNKLKQEDSGLNHVLARIASKNRIKVGINMNRISSLQKEEKAKRIAKLIQNIKICKKTNTPLIIINSKNKQNEYYFLFSLGASTKQAKEATQDF